MAFSIGKQWFLTPAEAFRIDQAFRMQSGKSVTRRMLKNMYLELKYGVPNPDKVAE